MSPCKTTSGDLATSRNVGCFLRLLLNFGFKKFSENALRFVTDAVLNILPCSADFTRVDGPTMLEVSIILCLFIHNSRSKHKTSITSVRLRRMIALNFVCEGPFLCAIVDFLVLEVFNINNLLSEAVVGLKLFYPKSFRKQFCAFLKAAKGQFARCDLSTTTTTTATTIY